MSTVVMLPVIHARAAEAAALVSSQPTAASAGAAEEPLPAPLVLVRRARRSDLPAMMELLDRYARRGLLLPRTPEQVRRQLADFVVAVDVTGVIGCAGLRRYPGRMGEIVGLAVEERCQGRGIGRHLVDALLDEARSLGLRRVFALTLQEGFFHRMGFRTTSVAEFPDKIALDCSGCAKRATCAEVAVVLDLDS
ncbi:MAG: GNAT family N-acetyltransferase [bacterium]|nr:MAG: GNAT family N-acetyltransferase [bacterium]